MRYQIFEAKTADFIQQHWTFFNAIITHPKVCSSMYNIFLKIHYQKPIFWLFIESRDLRIGFTFCEFWSENHNYT